MVEETKKESVSFHVTDKRFWVEDDSIISDAPLPQPKYPSYVEDLKARTEAAEQKLKERLKVLDQENATYRERLNRQLEQRLSQAKAEFIRNLLEVVDNLERALAAADNSTHFPALVQGVALNLELLVAKLRQEGVEPVECKGLPFDPAEAEAIGVVDVSEPAMDHRVVEVVQKGYRFADLLLRPAVVKVGRFVEEQLGTTPPHSALSEDR